MFTNPLRKSVFFAFGVIGVLSVSAQAQRHNSLGATAYEVAELVSENARDLSHEEVREVRGLLERIRSIVGSSVYNISLSGGQFTHDLALSVDVSSTSEFLSRCLSQMTRPAYYVNSLKTTVDYSRTAKQEFRDPTFFTSAVQICGASAGLAANMGVPVLPADRGAQNLVAFSVMNKTVTLRGRNLQEIGRACHNTNAINNTLYAFELPMSINGAQLQDLKKGSGRGYTSKSEVCEAVLTTVARSIRTGEGIFRDLR